MVVTKKGEVFIWGRNRKMQIEPLKDNEDTCPSVIFKPSRVVFPEFFNPSEGLQIVAGAGGRAPSLYNGKHRSRACSPAPREKQGERNPEGAWQAADRELAPEKEG